MLPARENVLKPKRIQFDFGIVRKTKSIRVWNCDFEPNTFRVQNRDFEPKTCTSVGANMHPARGNVLKPKRIQFDFGIVIRLVDLPFPPVAVHTPSLMPRRCSNRPSCHDLSLLRSFAERASCIGECLDAAIIVHLGGRCPTMVTALTSDSRIPGSTVQGFVVSNRKRARVRGQICSPLGNTY